MRVLACSWLQEAHAKTGVLEVDVVNNAVEMSGRRQLALHHGMQMVFRGEEGICELPVMASEHVPKDDDEHVSYRMLYQNAALLDWAQQVRGSSYEATVHDGLRILGVFAMLPRDKIIIEEPDSAKKGALEPNLGGKIQYFPPFPSNL
ncbi:MAG TPA: hypothetical protein VLE73_01065 [Candidatus Saccharimonadales bacterium]|nr:hypothetical protein [Candidatus Saccharimonadales bacterium]